MSRLLAGVVAGALAGAAGATALDAVSYGDRLLRGRPAGSSPKATVDAVADATGTEVPGDAVTAPNRADGAGQLAGIGVGVGVGAVAGILRAHHVKVPKALSPLALGLAALALSNTVMTALHVTEPTSRTPGSVAADAVPHLAYGLVATATLHRLLDPRTPHAG